MTPYTYLIGWPGEGLFYYGVRYAKSCDPSDLWKSYFTSSTRVTEFRKSHGEPTVVQVRHTFTCPLAARKWEARVLSRIGAVRSSKWLNLANGGFEFCNAGPATAEKIRASKIGKQRGPHTQSAKDKIAEGNRGKSISAEHRAILSATRKGCVPWNKGLPSPMKGKPRSSDVIEKIRHTLKGRPLTQAHKDSLSLSAINRHTIKGSTP